MAKRTRDKVSRGKGRRSAHNKLTKKYERQRVRTAANKQRRIERQREKFNDFSN